MFSVLPKLQGWISPKDTLWEFWDIWSLLEEWHLCKQPGFGLSQNSQSVCHQELCAFGSAPVPCTQAHCAKSWQHLPCWLPPPAQGTAEIASSLTWAAESGVCSPLLPPNPSMPLWTNAGTCFYGYWWTRNSSEKGDGTRHSTFVPPRQMFVMHAVSPQEGAHKSHSQPVSGMSFLTSLAFLCSLWLLTPGHPSLRNYWARVKWEGRCWVSHSSALGFFRCAVFSNPMSILAQNTGYTLAFLNCTLL